MRLSFQEVGSASKTIDVYTFIYKWNQASTTDPNYFGWSCHDSYYIPPALVMDLTNDALIASDPGQDCAVDFADSKVNINGNANIGSFTVSFKRLLKTRERSLFDLTMYVGQ